MTYCLNQNSRILEINEGFAFSKITIIFNLKESQNWEKLELKISLSDSLGKTYVYPFFIKNMIENVKDIKLNETYNFFKIEELNIENDFNVEFSILLK